MGALLAAPGIVAAQQPSSGHGTMPAMDHSQMAMDRPAPRDSNQAFLRMNSDHHQGLIQLADTALAHATRAATKADAHKLRDKQASEQRMMLGMLRRQDNDTITPMVLPSNQAYLDTLSHASGATVDPTFYRLVVAHHREGIAMIDRMLPSLTGQVRAMALKGRAEQQREIPEMQRKMARLDGQMTTGR